MTKNLGDSLPGMGEGISTEVDLYGAFVSKSTWGAPNMILPKNSIHLDKSGKHSPGFNETNPGLGFSIPVNSLTNVFAVAYHNSYRDNTLVAGVQYMPIRTNTGPFEAKLGISAGVAYTENGSYAQAAPQFSAGKLTAMGGLHAEITHKPSGVGVEATVVPPGRGETGVAVIAMSMKYPF